MPLKMRHQERAVQIGGAILACLVGAGIVVSAAAAPGIVALLRYLPERRRRYECSRALRRLIRRGFVDEVVRRGEVVGHQITDRGREYLARCELARAEFQPPKKWDGKWRLVVFDVREKQRHLRDDLRAHFRRLGLYPIQKSVWLFPYSCDDLVRLVKASLGLDRNVQYFTVGRFEDREEEKLWRLRFDV